MGLGKVIGWGILLVLLAYLALYFVAVALAPGIMYGAVPIGWLITNLAGAVIWAVIAYFVGRRFIRAVKEYRASRALRATKPGKPLQ